MPDYRIVSCSILAALGLLSAGTSQESKPEVVEKAAQTPAPLDPQKVRTLEELVAELRAREGRIERMTMRIETKGRTPDGRTFSTEGSMRVLGKTHFQVRTRWSFGDDLKGETETVRTPEGVWMHEEDPAQGQVYTHMEKALMERVDAASRALGEESPAGAGQDEPAGPLGSRMLADLGSAFVLRVEGPRTIDGAEVMVVSGARKPGVEDEMLASDADRVDILVRVADGAVVRMTQLQDGLPISEVRVLDLDRDPKLAPESFVLTPPQDVNFVDVMSHPPAAEQITRLFADARAKGWIDPTEPDAETGSIGTDAGKKR